MGTMRSSELKRRLDDLYQRYGKSAINPDPLEPQATSRGIAKGVCGSLLASAAMLIQ